MSKIGLPVIDITFIQKAVSAIQRSERGTACIVVKGSVDTPTLRKYKYESDMAASDYTVDMLAALKRCFLVPVNKVYVLSVPNDTEEFSVAAAALEGVKFNYICTVEADWQQAVVNYIINKNNKSAGKKYIGLVAGATTADSKYIINIKNPRVHDVDTDAWVTMPMYLPRVIAVLCNLPMNRSCTYYEFEDIDEVDTDFITTENDIDYWINAGYIVFFKDEDVIKIGRGVNSLTTFTASDTEDMRKIIIVESMNLILEDIYETFKDYYVGKYKNSYDNQCLFISAVNSYFRQLAREEILDPDYDNVAYVDVEAQREAWLGIGKTEAEDWNEEKVKEMSFKSFVYLAGDIKILDAIEDLHFRITMQ